MMVSEKPFVVVDIEIYHGFFLICMKRLSDGKIVVFEYSDRADFDRERVRKILQRHTVITFNGKTFDIPLIYYALEGATLQQLKQACDRIIGGNVRWWEVEELLGIRIPRNITHWDLIEPQPNPFISLKSLNGRMHGKTLQDLPFPPDYIPTHADMDELIAYCGNDLQATENLFRHLEDPLEMRRVMGIDLGVDLMSKSDTQMGLAIIKHRVEKTTGKRIEKMPVKAGTAFKYHAPDYIKFESEELRSIFERIKEHDFIVNHEGKVDLPKWLAETKICLGSSVYQMGIGGLHSTESGRAVYEDDDYILIDADVGGFYPRIIITLGLYPPAVGPVFIPVYGGIHSDRMVAKRAKDKARDKGLKIAGNGIFGGLGNWHMFVHAPHLLIAVTLTGQLSLLMLIERAINAGMDIVSGNTDGIVFHCPRHMFNGLILDDKGKETVRLEPSILADLTGQWEQDTGFDLEFVQYTAILNRDVNNYFAIKADGGHKRKGVYSNPWSSHPDDVDYRAQLMKNPQATICSDAVLNYVKDGTAIEDTIYACQDIRQFVNVVKSTTGATWRGKYLGKTVRFYWSTDGNEILKAKPHDRTGNFAMVPRTEGSAPCMTLPDELPDDIDYDRYIAETKQMLIDIGFLAAPPPKPKMVRFTKANTAPILISWALAA